MMSSFPRIAIGTALATTLHASPAIYLHSVLNAANYSTVGLPGGSIAHHQLFRRFHSGRAGRGKRERLGLGLGDV